MIRIEHLYQNNYQLFYLSSVEDSDYQLTLREEMVEMNECDA